MKKQLIILLTLILLFLSIHAKELNLLESANNNNSFKITKNSSLPHTHAISTINNRTKGEKLFTKKLQKYCEMSSGKFAFTYSQDEWEEIAEAGKFDDIILEICPKLKDKYNEKWTPTLYQFAYMYASDSGNVPSS